MLTFAVMAGTILNLEMPLVKPATKTVFSVIENNSGKDKVVDWVAKKRFVEKE